MYRPAETNGANVVVPFLALKGLAMGEGVL